MNYSHEQATHDEVNLLRLVRRLEKSIASEKDWDDAAANQQERVFLQALGTLQKVKFGRKLLRNLEQYDTDPLPKKSRQRNDIKAELDRIELFMTEVQKRTEPVQPRPQPILPNIPVPALSAPELDPAPDTMPEVAATDETGKREHEREMPLPLDSDAHEEPLRQRESLARSPPGALSTLINHTSTTSPPATSLLSPISSLLPATPTPTSAPSFLSRSSTAATSTAISTSASNTLNSRKQTSNALQEELTAQLAQMATQLKLNTLHFSDSLVKDKAVIEETQEKLEDNFGTMLAERFRLRDFRGKSGSTTWMVVGVVVAVLLLFVIMVGVIRFSRGL
ncbi:hypothetical protein P691DRAFT_735883 [Macrolepiota fuliginosa MF-IS2]|uniref:Uncharacterized protein n=1 Tax=Macrolepiota fuliginosa MF-IS2 TaxID=1400762 RepID=A0A9P6BY84_9AGAR|nr:hypothetical protein P691DRAFT_735883 [Macrolepiota fuliginosa MF-IS2]